jgi:hypothetical protein
MPVKEVGPVPDGVLNAGLRSRLFAARAGWAATIEAAMRAAHVARLM